MMSQRTKNSFLYLTLTVATLIGFQNCTASRFSGSEDTQQNKSGSNGGFDGKMYVHTGNCVSDSSLVDTRVEVSSDGSMIVLLRENCTDLSAPYQDVSADFGLETFSFNVIYRKSNGLIFDPEVSPQRSTQLVCVGNPGTPTSPALKVWTLATDRADFLATFQIPTPNATTAKVTDVTYDQVPIGLIGDPAGVYLYDSVTANTTPIVNLTVAPGGVIDMVIAQSAYTPPPTPAFCVSNIPSVTLVLGPGLGAAYSNPNGLQYVSNKNLAKSGQ
jgi:hypothetical protein